MEPAPHPDDSLNGLSLEVLLDRIASDLPTPGGGSVSAIAGALAAALATMVWNLTRSRASVDPSEKRLDEAVAELLELRAALLASVDADAAAYDGVIAAMRLPKSGDAERAARRDAIEKATRVATEIPLGTARLCASVMRQCLTAVRWGFAGAVTDAGVGLLLASAGLNGALYNVEINLRSLKDEAFAAAVAAQVAELRAEADEVRRAGDLEVRRRIAS